jgi:hypothetical protein
MKSGVKAAASRPVEIRAVGVKGDCFEPLKVEVIENGRVRVILIPDPRQQFIAAWRRFDGRHN